jgi:hypothetical protein
VDKTGNLRLAVGRMASSPFDFVSQILRKTDVNCR